MSVLPVGWADSSLGDLLAVLRGVSYQKNEAQDKQDEGLIPLLRANNIQSSSIVLDDLVFVPVSCVSDTQQLTAGDIVIAASSGSRSVVGKAARITTTMPITFGAFCYALRVNPEVSNEFIAYFLQSPGYRKEISNLSAGININNLKREHIETFPISLPPLNQQRRIVATLDALFEKSRSIREKLDSLPRLLGNLQKSILNSAFRGDLTKEWRTKNAGRQWLPCCLEDCCLSISDGDHQAPPKSISGVPFITIGAINDYSVELSRSTKFVPDDYFRKLKPERKPQRGDVLFSVTGSIGIPALVESTENFCFQRHIALIRPDPQKLDSNFLFYLLRSDQIQSQAYEVATGVAQMTIPLKDSLNNRPFTGRSS